MATTDTYSPENIPTPVVPRCIGCKLTPDEIPEYVEAAAEEGMTPIDYVKTEEGTYNKLNGHFACTDCYFEMGAPTAPWPGWKAP